MTTATLLSDLRARGITLAADGDRLRFHPRDAVGPDLLARIKEHKQDLLRLLAQAPTTTTPAASQDLQADDGQATTVGGPELQDLQPQDNAGPDLTGWTTYRTPDGRQGIESPKAGPRWRDDHHAPRLLAGDEFPPPPPADVDPRILATPVDMCPRCGAARVLSELAGMTGGTCWGCHVQDLQALGDGPQNDDDRQPQARPRPRRTRRDERRDAPAPTVFFPDLPEHGDAPKLGVPSLQNHAAGPGPAGRGAGPTAGSDTADPQAPAEATAKGQATMRVERRGGEWWITGMPPYMVDGETCTDCGPYATKAEAVDDLRGMRRATAGENDDAGDE